MKTSAIATGTVAVLVSSVVSQHDPYAGYSRYGGGAGIPNGVGSGYSTYGKYARLATTCFCALTSQGCAIQAQSKDLLTYDQVESNHPSWPTQTGSALSQIIDGSSAAPSNHPTGPPTSVASSLSAHYSGNSYGPNNHPSAPASGLHGPPAGVASSLSAQYGANTYGPNNHPTAPVAGSNGAPAGVVPTSVPVPLSSWLAHSDHTTYGPNNHPSSAPADVPASVSSYFANSAWTTLGPSNHPTARPSGAPAGAGGHGGHDGAPFGPGGPNGHGYPSWLNTASGTATAGACPPATWSGWTQGDFATNPAWTAWPGALMTRTAHALLRTPIEAEFLRSLC